MTLYFLQMIVLTYRNDRFAQPKLSYWQYIIAL